MKETENKQIILDEVIIPYCTEGGIDWYPIRYIMEQLLLRSKRNLHSNEEYKPYIKKCVIDYTFKGTVPQETHCMNKKGWILFLSQCRIYNRTDIKIKRNNIFCDYLGCIENKYEVAEDKLYDDYMKDCIENVVSENKDITFRKCTKCNRSFPLHGNFFPFDNRVPTGFTGACKMCKPSAYPIVHANIYARRVYSTYGNEAYLLYMNDTTEFIKRYKNDSKFEELHLHSNFKPYMKTAEKEAILQLIKSDYINNNISVNDLNNDFALTKYKIKVRKYTLTDNLINEYCTDNDCKIRPWKYPCYKIGKLDFDTGKKILATYIEDNNIHIDNILEYNKYEELLKKAKLVQFTMKSWTSLEFIVKYYNNEYAGYKYKLKATNYYKKKENMIFDMKWLIEKELKIQIEKIPLYITKTYLNNNTTPLYNALYKKYNYNSLFEWINDCYPDKFIELDFHMNHYRNIFDSDEEAQVDRVLREKCDNVIYNIRNTDNEVSILGMSPDWIIIGNKGTMLVEYFGLYLRCGSKYSDRLVKYKEKMKVKFKKYGELLKVGYKHLYIYPTDLKNNFEGLNRKLEVVNKLNN